MSDVILSSRVPNLMSNPIDCCIIFCSRTKQKSLSNGMFVFMDTCVYVIPA